MDLLYQIWKENGFAFFIVLVIIGVLLFVIWLLIRAILNYAQGRAAGLFEKLDLYEKERDKDTATNKKMSTESIQTVKLETNALRLKMDSFSKTLEDFKSQTTREMLEHRAHTTDAHNLSTESLRQMKEAMEKVGRFLEMKEKVDMTYGMVKVIEANIERNATHHRANMQTIGTTIGKHAVDIANLKKGKS